MTPHHQATKSSLNTRLREQVCDTCTTRPPVELFDCRPFARMVLGSNVIVRYLDGWALCSACAGLVRSRSWQALITRVVNRTRHTLGVPNAAIRAELTDLFNHLDQHLTGQSTPLDGAQ
ncbi:hypothetical protein ABTZ99_13470 [Actinosynnema sp. NPDC002837]